MRKLISGILFFISIVASGQIIPGVVASSRPTTTLYNGLQAFWNLNETSGILYDATSNDYDLTNAEFDLGQTGKIGYCVVGDEASDHLIGPTTGLRLTTLTISAWVKSISTTGSIVVLSKYWTAPTRGYMLYMTSAGKVIFKIYHSTSGEDDLTGATTINTGNWVHIIITMTPSEIRLYINNTEDANSPHALTFSPDFYASTPIYLGNIVYENSGWIGSLDLIGIWNRVITSTERAELNNSGNGKAYPF